MEVAEVGDVTGKLKQQYWRNIDCAKQKPRWCLLLLLIREPTMTDWLATDCNHHFFPDKQGVAAR